ncbi:MgtC/SapB family protein [uncultured Oscillibacter sp.]|uniref:MgtC/SapB family protein n=1 Tax=uncultured Oscillibacter sp. TaxID=876091 RepID=UPI00260BAB67|nr:MgtC/SapB family protein [uncultured Oscillibacter sp.]
MLHQLDYLREVNTVSVLLRLTLAMFCGGMIGLERARKHRPAGFRTYMLVCMAAALTMLLSQYESYMLHHVWAEKAAEIGIRTDVSRFGAQVINGIGFLGAGTILVTGQQKVKGLTTAAGLWASACMGLAVGAGFYECVGLAFLLIFLVVHLLPAVELYIVENAKNMNIYVEFQSLDNVAEIINRIKSKDVTIYEVEVDHGKQTPSQHPNAIFSLRMNRPGTHAKILAAISELEDVYVVHDI